MTIVNVLILTGSPNTDGLTAACGLAAKAGAEKTGAEAVIVDLNKLNIGNCHACGKGWGTCGTKHTCQVKDDFQDLHASLADYDAYVLVTPVYWGEMSESCKAFVDRVRRNEAKKKEATVFEGKPVLSIAAAGGSGNGLTTCLTSMERFLLHVRAEKFDLIGVTQKNKRYKLDAIREAAFEMMNGLKKEE